MSENAPIRVLVVDDHAVVRQGVVAMLDPRPDVVVIGEAADGEEAVEKAYQLSPDVILMDLMMEKSNGIEATWKIKEKNPDARILVLTSYADDDQVLQALKAGAIGYILKVSPPEELVQAIRNVHAGELSLSPSIARKLLNNIAEIKTSGTPAEALTEREVQVLKLIAKGLSNLDIANQLEIGEGTVRSHVTRILHKLHLENRTQAALFALREGMSPLYPPSEDGVEGK